MSDDCCASGLCPAHRFIFMMNVLATEERIKNMTDEEWTKILVWAAEFESLARTEAPTP